MKRILMSIIFRHHQPSLRRVRYPVKNPTAGAPSPCYEQIHTASMCTRVLTSLESEDSSDLIGTKRFEIQSQQRLQAASQSCYTGKAPNSPIM